jgi:hypothetical protein
MANSLESPPEPKSAVGFESRLKPKGRIMKLNLSVAVLAAAAIAFAASPADAASKKKKSKGSKAKVTVSQKAPATGYWAGGFNNCASASATMWLPFAAVGTVGCGVVYAVPVMVEGFVAPRSSKA